METEAKTVAETATESLTRPLNLRVLGIGGAGGNAVDYMARLGLEGVRFVAVNTDSRALQNLALNERFTLGAKLTRGLGTGGDPDMGRAAAEEDLDKLREFCTGADVICVVAGLGGGTGTGASPVVARLAKETGALVLGIATLPFEFEGSRRQRQAQLGLRDFKAAADGVICLPNAKIMKLIDEKTSMEETLKITNELLAEGVRGIWRLLTQTGLINVDFNDLCAVLRGRHEESTLATVEASGENRVAEILQKLSQHPFLEGGQVLAEADGVLASLAGGPDMTMAEVNRLMEQINRQCENAHIIMGAGIQEALKGKLSVTLVASRGSVGGREDYVKVRHAALRENGPAAPSPNTMECEHDLANPKAGKRPPSRFKAPAPDMSLEEKEKMLTQQPGGKRRKAALTQGHLQLEIVSKGRFEKSEPTIHQGEDLDVPTYIRRGVALN